MRCAPARVMVVACAAALLLVLATAALSSGAWTPRAAWVNADNLAVLAGLIAAGACARAGCRGRGRLRASWLLLGSMVLLFAAGDVLWLVFAHVAGTPQVLSFADSLYLAALVPGSLGLVIYPVTRGMRSALGPVLLDAAVLGSSVILASQVFVFREVVAGADSASEAFILVVYPVTDLLLVCLVLILMLRSVGDTRVDVALLGLTFVAYAVADNGYALSVVRDTDYTQGLVAVAYVVAPLFLALSAVGSTTFTTRSRLLQRRHPGTWAAVLPDLAALVALAGSVVWLLEDRVVGGLAAAVLVLTGVRQLASTSRAYQWRCELERRIAERTEEVTLVTERHRELEAMKYAFLSAVSHELRTPLTAIRGSLELLEDGDGGELTPHGQRVVAVAVRGTQRLSRIVDDVMDLERFTTGTFGVAPSRCELRALTQEVAESLETVAQARGVELAVVHAELEVWCDGDRVIQAVVNLVANALKFAPAGSRIVLDAARLGDEVRVSVQDQGRGIPTDQLDKVFDRFHQIDPLDARTRGGGAGLGLTITRHIVEAHGGRIWVESTPGQGSTFTFTLPVAPPATTTVLPASAPGGDVELPLAQG